MSITTCWQRNEQVLAAARTDMWPAGTHKLGVHFRNGVAWNCGEIDRRIAAGEYTASQCLSRLTDGMPNHHGPDNGPGRPTLATKCKNFGFPAADVDRQFATSTRCASTWRSKSLRRSGYCSAAPATALRVAMLRAPLRNANARELVRPN